MSPTFSWPIEMHDDGPPHVMEPVSSIHGGRGADWNTHGLPTAGPAVAAATDCNGAAARSATRAAAAPTEETARLLAQVRAGTPIPSRVRPGATSEVRPDLEVSSAGS